MINKISFRVQEFHPTHSRRQVPLANAIGTADAVRPEHVGQQDGVGEAVLSVEHRSDRLAQTVHGSETFGETPRFIFTNFPNHIKSSVRQ